MPSRLTNIRASNTFFTPTSRPVLVVFGGTSGIGAGIIRTFAHHTSGRIHAIIIGRSRSEADALIKSLPQHTESQYEFVEHDGTLIRNVRSLARDLCQRLSKINYLVLSQGALDLGASHTDEGFNPSVALMVFGRARAALDLAPLLEKAAARGEDARVMSIMNAGVGGPIDLSDLSWRHFDIWSATGALSTYSDIFTLELAKRMPNASVTHVFPGAVRTRLARSLPWYLRWPARIVSTVSPNNCGEWMMSILVDPTTKTGAWFRRAHGQHVPPSRYADESTRAIVWQYFEDATGAL